MQEHDISYKLLFGEKEVFLDLLRCLMEENAVDYISSQKLCKLPTEHIQKSRSFLKNDLIWMTKDGVFLFVIEFQSSFDDEMNSRMRIYTENARRARDECTGNDNIPYVAPIVVSNIGDSRKFEAISRCYRMPELFNHESAKLFLYGGKPYSSLDMIDFRPPFRTENNLVSAIHDFELFRKKVTDTRMFLKTMQKLAERIGPDDSSLNSAFLGWIRSSLFPESNVKKCLEKCCTIKGAVEMLENTMPVWEKEIAKKNFEEGRVEGRVEGRLEGHADALFFILKDKFSLDSIPESIKKITLGALEKIGMDKAMGFIKSSSTLKDYENRISGKHETKARQAPRP